MMIFLTVTSVMSNVCAQISVASVEQSFADHRENNFREKVFVHVNKSFYTAGEIMWFKLYCTDAQTNKPAGLSKIAYVELIDGDKNPVMQTMISLNYGTGSGSFYLPFSINSGVFKLRAYTSWMRNFDPAYFFERTIKILNPLRPNANLKSNSHSVDVQFMPEGGHLVQGINSRVAFKITGNDGKGVPAAGAIINNRGDTVSKFSTFKFGIGSFMIKPIANESYKAVVKINNQSFTSILPQVSPFGYVLQVTDKGDSWAIAISYSDSTISKQAYVILHNNYVAKQVKKLQLVGGSANIIVNKTEADDGVSYITVFNDAGAPVCERSVFKKAARKLTIMAATNQPEFSKRSKVAVSLISMDESEKDIQANLSVSVFRADGLQDKDPEHISGYVWLRGALKGNIESPDYYLNNDDRDADEALDNLLLSQGWTEFDWSSPQSAGKMHFLPEYIGPIIRAQISEIVDNKPAPNKLAYLTINGSPQQFYIGKSDSTGMVRFNVQKFYGLHEIVAQTNGKVDSTYRIVVQSPFAEPGNYTITGNRGINTDIKRLVSENSVNMQVQNIFTANQIKQFYPAIIDSNWFFGIPAKSYKLDDYTRFSTMEEVLREYVGSISVAKHQGKFEITIFHGEQPLGNPLVLLDGIPVFDADQLFKWDPLRIKRLDMIMSNYLYGPMLFNGIMSFTTYKGDGAAIQIDPHAVVLDYSGLQQERRFYSPAYDSTYPADNPIPDFRTALYWDPDFNISGKSNFTFYTSDKSGKYIGIVEGISSDGRTGSGFFTFTVKK
ncbi:MAG: hypothetical protein JKY70_23200 [Mucilaginibacter sp.]|nr:hypothetical protein [Mucilaginibacter sp.]